MRLTSLIPHASRAAAAIAFGLCSLATLRAGASEPAAAGTTAPAAANEFNLVVSAQADTVSAPLGAADETFANLIGTAFRRNGFRGTLAVAPATEGRAAAPTLHVRLLTWRVSSSGSVDCTFTASLETNGGAEDLGVFIGLSAPEQGPSSSAGHPEDLERAATDAIDDLFGRLRDQRLINAANT